MFKWLICHLQIWITRKSPGNAWLVVLINSLAESLGKINDSLKYSTIINLLMMCHRVWSHSDMTVVSNQWLQGTPVIHSFFFFCFLFFRLQAIFSLYSIALNTDTRGISFSTLVPFTFWLSSEANSDKHILDLAVPGLIVLSICGLYILVVIEVDIKGNVQGNDVIRGALRNLPALFFWPELLLAVVTVINSLWSQQCTLSVVGRFRNRFWRWHMLRLFWDIDLFKASVS